MTTIALATLPASPGATVASLALLYAWPVTPGYGLLLVEADPSVGPIRAGHLQTRIGPDHSLANLAVPARDGNLGRAITTQLINLGEDDRHLRMVLPGVIEPAEAAGFGYAWEAIADTLAHPILDQVAIDVLIDLGRNGTTGAQIALARRADIVLAVVRPTLDGLMIARPHLASLVRDLNAHGAGPDIAVLLVDAEPLAPNRYPPNEVAQLLQLDVLPTALPHDPRTAAWLTHGGDRPKHFDRSELLRAARSLVNPIQSMAAARSMRLSPTAPRSMARG
jgi:hypothetical protein